MRLLVSFCNLPTPRPTGLLELDTHDDARRWVPVNGGTPAVQSTTGIACTDLRAYVVWLSTDKQCFLSLLERPSLGLIDVYPLAGVRDAHSVTVVDGDVFVVSTGTDELWRFPTSGDRLGPGHAVWRASAEGRDTHHVNAVAYVDARICCSAFGPKPGPLWSTAIDGYVIDVERNEKLGAGLEHPHSLVAYNGDVYIAESRRARVRCLTRERSYDVGGYARGLCVLPDGRAVTATSTARRQSKSTGIVENPADPGESTGRAALDVRRIDDGAPQGPMMEIDLSEFGSEIYDVICLAA